MTEGYLLGLDVGTTFCKAALVTTDGREVAHGRAPTPWTLAPTGAEADPRALVEAALAAGREALAAAPHGRVLAVGVTGMAETGALLDGRGDPVAPAIAWHDYRGDEEAAALARDLGPDRFIERTGLAPRSLLPIVKYRWLRRNLPESVRGVRWLSVAEWVVHTLGGDDVAELSLASRTGFLDLEPAGWWDEALSWANAPSGLLPEPRPAGTDAGVVSEDAFPEAAGAVLAVGGHDHPCAAVGAGATREGDVFDSCGTAEALVRATRPPLDAKRIHRAVAGGVTVGWHTIAGRLELLAGFKSGMAMQRFQRLLGVDQRVVADLDAEALRVPAGAEGLVVTDVTAPEAGLSGIGWQPSPGHVWRAVLEAVARHGAGVLRTIEEVAGPTARLVVSGGWARSEAVRVVKRDILGPFEHPPVVEAGARGAALLAGCAAGLYRGIDDLPPPLPTAPTRP